VTGFEKSELSSLTFRKFNFLAEKIVFSSNPSVSDQKDADCLLCKFNAVDRQFIDSLPKLKYIGVMSTGYAKVDTNYAKSKGIVVTNVPGYSTESVAEFVVGVILEYIRQLEKGKVGARAGNYSEAGFSATEIKNKTFGILGLGKIGSRVAGLALGFGAHVCYWSRERKKNLERKGIKFESADILIPKCDFLSLHFALNKQTEGFLNARRIAKIKKRAVVVNTAPMELVVINALEKRLKAGDITFILDHSDEMTGVDLKKLSKYRNCIIYPPIAYISKEAGEAKQRIFVENIENFLKGSPSNVV
ncbi:hypothetical protein A2165_03740, partial [Candidatus Curtissbacteria bacterium RBG_13_40_7]